jgi:hypothetical protein
VRRSAALVVLGALALGLAGCSPAPGTSTGTPAPGASASAPQPSATEDAELATFRSALAGQSPADPDRLVAALEAAGFARDTIERTREIDSLGAPVTFLEVAVRGDADCLLGQVGEGEATAMRAELLGGGGCLVGDAIVLD